MIGKFTKTALMLALTFGAAQSFAQEAPSEARSYLSLDYNEIFHNGNRASQNGRGGGLSFGLALAEHWGLETSAFYNGYGTNNARTSDWNEYGAKLDGLFFYQRKRIFSPYFGVGVGGIRSNERVSNQSSTDPFVDVGLGAFTYFGIGPQDFAVRADARYRWLDTHSINGVGNVSEPVVKVSLVLPLGARAVAAAPVVAAREEPIREPEPAPVRARQEPVVESAPAATVNTHVYEAVHFNYKDTDLTSPSKSTLDQAASEIKDLAKKSAVKVEVDGHTDNVGSDSYNQRLSERRAKIVTQYLTKKGVDGKTITTKAYGESQPAKSNDTEEGRAYNRRVEVKAIAE
jgi:OOP family OmpA-OmpF porin